jgi:thiol-disulfide isomerase/thioredoxin
MKKTIFLIVAIIFCYKINAQYIPVSQNNGRAIVGIPFPNFILQSLTNYNKPARDMNDFRGKYIILDFFNTYCIPCVRSLKKLDSIQQKHNDELQILMVTFQKQNEIKEFLKKSKLENIMLPFITNDSIFHKYALTPFYPFYIIIDRNGIIQAITSSDGINENKIDRLLKGDKVDFPIVDKSYYETKRSLNKPLLIDTSDMDADKILYTSLLTKKMDKKGRGGMVGKKYTSGDVGVQITSVNSQILNLYEIAYGNFKDLELYEVTFGQNPNFKCIAMVPGNRIKLKVKDASKIRKPFSENFEDWSNINAYSYELIVPKNLADEALTIMKQELKLFFNYSAEFESVHTKCLVFKRIKAEDKIKTKGGEKKYEISPSYIRIQNAPFKYLFWELENKFLLYKFPVQVENGFALFQDPLIDETRINENIDLEISADIMNPKTLSEALNPYGIEIVEEDRDVTMLVIKDRDIK